jgi:tRNA A-37 threonylcarbamoyl transferase component Bud32
MINDRVQTCSRCNETYESDVHDCPRDHVGTVRLRPDSAPSDELVGRRIGGYVVEASIGRGGMGVVYRARHPVLGKLVAVKVIRSEHAADEDFRRRFMDEARVLAALDDPRIVAIQDLALLPDGRAYLVMEHVDGELLSARLRRGKLSVDEALHVAREILAGLAAAHARGIIHRDIKPSNIAIVGSSVKLLDFGLAKLRDRVGASVTHSGAVVGTPGYMPPEQANARGVQGAAVDVYAVGIVLYELIAGRRPFDIHGDSTDDWVEILIRQRTTDPPPLPDVPVEIDRVVRRALARDPAARYANASDMLVALGDDPPHAPTTARVVPRATSRRNLALAIGGAAVAAGSVIAWRVAASTSSAPTERDAGTPRVVAPAAKADAGLTVQDLGIDGMTFSPPAASGVHRFDPSAYLATATVLARQQFPDAVLVTMSAGDLGPDGTIDTRDVEGNIVRYEFRSPAASKRAPGELAGKLHRCMVAVAVGKSLMVSQYSGFCEEPAIAPRCSIARVVAAARAKGAPANTVMYAKTQPTTRGLHWFVSAAAKPYDVADDCPAERSAARSDVPTAEHVPFPPGTRSIDLLDYAATAREVARAIVPDVELAEITASTLRHDGTCGFDYACYARYLFRDPRTSTCSIGVWVIGGLAVTPAFTVGVLPKPVPCDAPALAPRCKVAATFAKLAERAGVRGDERAAFASIRRRDGRMQWSVMWTSGPTLAVDDDCPEAPP